jgi:hypothetical protein
MCLWLLNGEPGTEALVGHVPVPTELPSHQHLLLHVTYPACLAFVVRRLRLQRAYLGMQQQRSITITNTSRLPSQFSWTMQQLQLGAVQHSTSGIAAATAGSTKLLECRSGCSTTEGDGTLSVLRQPPAAAATVAAAQQCGQLNLQISPASGWLQPQQSLQLQLLLEPTKVGPVQLLCCCEVPAMSQLAGFVVEAFVEGLQVEYAIVRQPQQQQQQWLQCGLDSLAAAAELGSRGGTQQQLGQGSDARSAGESSAAAAAAADPGLLLADFGVTSIHQPCGLLLRVTNLTSISTSLRAWVARFPAAAAATAAAANGMQLQGRLCDVAAHEVNISTAGTGRQKRLSSNAGAAAAPAAAAVQGTTGSRAGSTAAGGLPISTLPASPAPLQQLASASGAHAALGSSGRATLTSSCGQQKPRRTGSGNQQQHQRPGIAARLAAAVSAGAAAGSALQLGSSSLYSASVHTGNSAAVTSSSLGMSLPGPPTSQTTATANLLQQQQHKQLRLGATKTSIPGPFRSSAGNSMMAARQIAAAAAAALGHGTAGCAVCVQPGVGELAGWGSVELQLLAHSNLPGTYVDELCIQVSQNC